jgi:hypothetical protein
MVGGIVAYMAASAVYQGSLPQSREYTSVTVDECYNKGAISGKAHYMGGIVASNSYIGTSNGGLANGIHIQNCYNAASVSNSLRLGYTGGILGRDENVNWNPYWNTPDYLNNNYNRGTVSNSSGNLDTGGIMGGRIGVTKYQPAKFNPSYNYYLKGSAAKASNSDPDKKYVYESFAKASEYSKLIANLGDSFAADVKSGTTGKYILNSGYPVLKWQVEGKSEQQMTDESGDDDEDEGSAGKDPGKDPGGEEPGKEDPGILDVFPGLGIGGPGLGNGRGNGNGNGDGNGNGNGNGGGSNAEGVDSGRDGATSSASSRLLQAANGGLLSDDFREGMTEAGFAPKVQSDELRLITELEDVRVSDQRVVGSPGGGSGSPWMFFLLAVLLGLFVFGFARRSFEDAHY